MFVPSHRFAIVFHFGNFNSSQSEAKRLFVCVCVWFEQDIAVFIVHTHAQLFAFLVGSLNINKSAHISITYNVALSKPIGIFLTRFLLIFFITVKKIALDLITRMTRAVHRNAHALTHKNLRSTFLDLIDWLIPKRKRKRSKKGNVRWVP